MKVCKDRIRRWKSKLKSKSKLVRRRRIEGEDEVDDEDEVEDEDEIEKRCDFIPPELLGLRIKLALFK